MTGERVCVRTHEVGSTPIKFKCTYTLDDVARWFHHDRSSGFIAVKTTGEGGLFTALRLNTELAQLRDEDDLEGDGSWDNSYIVRVERAGRSAHEVPPGHIVPDWLSSLFKTLADQNLQQCSLKLDNEEHLFHVLPLGAPLRLGEEALMQLYVRSVYCDAIELLLGHEGSSILPSPPATAAASGHVPLNEPSSAPEAAAVGNARRQAPSSPPEAAAVGQAKRQAPSSPPEAAAVGQAQRQAPSSPPEAAAVGQAQRQAHSSPPEAAAVGQAQRQAPSSPPEAAAVGQVQRQAPSSPHGAAAAGLMEGKAIHRTTFYLILGPAGVGKTTFLVFLAWVLLRLKKTILLHLRSNPGYILVMRHAEPMQNMTTLEANALLSTSGNWYLCDAVQPQTDGVAATSVLTASPKAVDIMNTFSKSCTDVWFGPWTLTELQCANSAFGSPSAPEIVTKHFTHFGGSARAVFQPAERFDDLLEQLNRLVDDSSTETLINAMKATMMREDMSNKIYHATADNKRRRLHQGPIIFASRYLGVRVLQALQRSGFDEVKRFVAACHRYGMFGAACGYMFETCVDKALTQGGCMELVHLASNTRLQLQLPRLTLRTFMQLQEVAGGEAGVWVPDGRVSWAVADHYVVLPHPVLTTEQVAQLAQKDSGAAKAVKEMTTFMVQTTVAESHQLWTQHFIDQSTQLNTTVLVWAVPENPKLTKPQPPLNKDRTQTKDPPPNHQFALHVPLLTEALKTAEAAQR